MSVEATKYTELLLSAGKSVLLAGAPGTGKTRLSLKLARRFTGTEPVVVVGRGDLGFREVFGVDGGVGGVTLSVVASWARLRAGCPPLWLVFDEVNRANVEVLLGELFTVLDIDYREDVPVIKPGVVRSILSSEEAINVIAEEASRGCEKVCRDDVKAVLESEVFKRGIPLPLSWRMIATMNVVDRAHLFRVGSALLRRLAMVYVPGIVVESVEGSRRQETRTPGGRWSRGLVENVCQEAIAKLLRPRLVRLGGVDVWDYCVPVVHSVESLAESVLARERFWSGLFHALKLVVETGLEVGYSIIADSCRLLAVEEALGERDDRRMLDLVLSSLVLPHLSTVVPQLKFEAAMGLQSSSRLRALRGLREFVDEVLGRGSMSDMVLRVVELELAL